MDSLAVEVDRIADETGFSGVVRVDRGNRMELAKAYGMAHRGLQIANTVDTQFGVASAVKGLTALTIVSLVVDGSLDLATTARSVLGADLPLIDDAVTVEQLLSHRSGIGDYLDEDTWLDITDYTMPVPVQNLVTTEQYLAVLDGHRTKFAPGAQFSYCNGGFVVLALIAERVRVCRTTISCSAASASQPEWPIRRSFAPTTSPGVPPSVTSRSTACGAATCSTYPCGATATAASTPRSAMFVCCGRRSSQDGSFRANG